MTIGICCDHAGFDLKEELKIFLQSKNIDIKDFGTHSKASMDYPDVAHPLAIAIENQEFNIGIAICGTGNGMAMSLNKHKRIRAGLAWNEDIASLIKAHNNANILVLPARFIDEEKAKAILTAWLDTEFEGGRHQKRIDKIPC